MSFQFIDQSGQLDTASKKQIRVQAAKGKNVGRKINRPSRLNASSTALAISRPRRGLGRREQDRAAQNHDEDYLVLKKIAADGDCRLARQVNDGFAMIQFPAFASSDMARSDPMLRATLHFIYGPRYGDSLGRILDPSADNNPLWYQLLFDDEAYFHGAIALSIVSLNDMCVRQQSITAALRHISQTFRIMNDRLASGTADSVSDRSIATVIMMAHYEHVLGRNRQVRVHVDGLRRMVDLRGGIFQLSQDHAYLARKVLRVDLEGGLLMGTSTFFSLQDVRASTEQTLEPELARILDQGLKSGLDINGRLYSSIIPDLSTLLLDMTAYTRLINDIAEGLRPRLDPIELLDSALLFGYRLVDTAVAHFSQISSADFANNMVLLGVTSLIATFLPGFNGKYPDPTVLHGIIASLTKVTEGSNLFSVDHPDALWREHRELLVWALCIGQAAGVFDAIEKSTWPLKTMFRVSSDLGLRSWSDVHQILARFPWLVVMHEKAGMRFWKKSTEFGNDAFGEIGSTTGKTHNQGLTTSLPWK